MYRSKLFTNGTARISRISETKESKTKESDCMEYNKIKTGENTLNKLLKFIISKYFQLYIIIKSIIHTRTEFEGQKYKNETVSKFIKKYIIYFPLVLEIYYIMNHILMVKMWILMNILCTFLFMYNILTTNNINDGIFHICMNDVDKLGLLCIILGIGMIIIYASEIGILTFLLIIYLINRTSKNFYNFGI